MAFWMVTLLLFCAVSVNSLPTNCSNNEMPTDAIYCADLTPPCVDYRDIAISFRRYDCTNNIDDFAELIVKCQHFSNKYENSDILKLAVLRLCNSTGGGYGRDKRDVQTQDWNQINQQVEQARKAVEEAKRIDEMVDRMSDTGINDPHFFDDVNAQFKNEEAKRQAEANKIRIWTILGVLAVGLVCGICYCAKKSRAPNLSANAAPVQSDTGRHQYPSNHYTNLPSIEGSPEHSV